LTALIVWGSVAALLTVLLTTKVGVRVSFGDGFKLWLIIGLIKKEFKFGDKSDSQEEKPEKVKMKMKSKIAKTESSASVKPEPAETEPKKSLLNGFDKKKLIKLCFRAMIGFFKLLRVDKLYFSYTAGGKSADKTAIAYGRMCAALGAFLPFADNFFRVRRRRISTDIDFSREKPQYSGVVQVTVITGAVLIFGIWALIEILKCRKEYNNG
jgi:hypothetical protein